MEIPDCVIRSLKDKIISSLDELYAVENQHIATKTKRIKELDLLIKNSYEDKVKGILLEEDYLEYANKWRQERDLLAIEIKNSGDINRSI